MEHAPARYRSLLRDIGCVQLLLSAAEIPSRLVRLISAADAVPPRRAKHIARRNLAPHTTPAKTERVGVAHVVMNQSRVIAKLRCLSPI